MTILETAQDSMSGNDDSADQSGRLQSLSHDIRDALYVIRTSALLLKRLGKEVENFDELIEAIDAEERRASTCLSEMLQIVRNNS